MYNKRYKKSNKIMYVMCTIIVILIYTISVCYSTLSRNLEISGLVKVRMQADIRVTGISIESNTDSVSNWEEYNVKNISSEVELTNKDSSITYKVRITNFGNVDMGIYTIDGLNDKLEYTLREDYKLKDKILKGGTQKDIYITIKYREGSYDENNTKYNILLNFDFRPYYTITYTNFPSDTNSLPQEIIKGDTLELDLSQYGKSRLTIKLDGLELSSIGYTYDNYKLNIPNVEGNIEIIYKKIPEIELVLRENDNNKTLSEDIQAGMYRYQGSYEEVTNNYICFGTSSKDECLKNEDKYMYRIIGITDDGQLELIKMTALNNEGTPWNNVSQSSLIDNKLVNANISWSKSDLYKRLNGLSINNDNLFIGNSAYDYLNSNSDWYNKIADTEWLSGALYWVPNWFGLDNIYQIETGQTSVNYYEEESVYEYNNGDFNEVDNSNDSIIKRQNNGVICEKIANLGRVICYKTITKQFDENINSKIGIMHLYDYDYSVQRDGFNCFSDNIWDSEKDTYKNGGEVCKASWMHLSHNDTNNIGYATNEWTITRNGFDYNNNQYLSWFITTLGNISDNILTEQFSARPVFYLTTDIVLKKGTTGEKDNPYIISISLGEFCDGQTNMGTCMTNKKSVIGAVDNITSNEVGGMYRYQGTDNVNNWICFGTSDKTQCTGNIDKYMYRIIGITPDGQLKLIKETGVQEDNASYKFAWNNKYKKNDCENDGSKCTWPLSTLFNRLNGLCKTGNANCTGIGTGNRGESNIFINNTYYDYLVSRSTWESIINTHNWKYGDSKELESYNGDNAYLIESQFTDYIEAKVGLQYAHDYLYAYPGGKPESYTNAVTSWIYINKDRMARTSYDCLISRYGPYYTVISNWKILPSGALDGETQLNSSCEARPVFYLKSDIKISNTEGSKTDPYTIDL